MVPIGSTALKRLKMLSELDTQQNIRDILVRCPNYVGAKWRNNALKCKSENDRYPTLEEFVTFISKIAADSCDPVYGDEAVKGMKSGRRSGLANSTSDTQSQASSQNVPMSISRTDQSRVPCACVVCDQFHKVYTCERDRLQIASRNNLCFNCLLPGHRAYICRNPMTCSVPECGRRHNKLLHTVQTSAEVPSPGTATDSAAAKGSVSASVTGPCAYLPVVKVVINGKYSALAMLDTASTNTFISSRLVSKLPKSNVTATYDMNTICSDLTESYKVVSVNVKSLDGGESLQLTDKIAYAYPEKTIDLSQYPYLSDVPIVTANAGVSVDILIGMDNAEALMPCEVRCGRVKNSALRNPYPIRLVFMWSYPWCFGQ